MTEHFASHRPSGDAGSLEKGLGVILAAFFVALYAGVFALEATMSEARLAAWRGAVPNVLFWWKDDPPWVLHGAYAMIVAPILLLPGAFGFKRWQLVPRLSANSKILLVAGLVLFGAVGIAIFDRQAGRSVGLATSSEALWIKNETVRARRPWSDASSVVVTCANRTTRKGGVYGQALSYDVLFPGDLAARLPADALLYGDWLRQIAPVDGSLRRLGVKRETKLDTGCLSRVARTLSTTDSARLTALFAP